MLGMTNTLPTHCDDRTSGIGLTTDTRKAIEDERVSRATEISRICDALHACGPDDVPRTRLYQFAPRAILIEMGVPLPAPAVETALRLMPASEPPLTNGVGDVVRLRTEE